MGNHRGRMEADGAQAEAPKAVVVLQCRATYDFDAKEEDELSLKPGDLVVATDTEGDWWTGSVVGGGTGLFPANRVEPFAHPLPEGVKPMLAPLDPAEAARTGDPGLGKYKLEECYDEAEALLDLTLADLSDLPATLLATMSNLQTLMLRQNGEAFKEPGAVSQIAALTPSLTFLDLYENGIADAQALEVLTSLTHLDLSFNVLRNTSLVAEMPQMKELYFVNNKISEIGPEIASLQELTLLELGDNRIRKISNVAQLPSLNSLWLAKNKITSLEGLSGLSSLRVLSMQANRITSMAGLTGLEGLEELYLSNNGIESMDGLGSLKGLKTLDLAANRISCISGMEGLVELEDFWFNSNPWETIGDLDSIACLTKLNTVYFHDTPAQQKAGAAYKTRVQAMLPSVKLIDISN